LDRIDLCCERCGEEYSYKQKDVREEVQIPGTFVPHPLFKIAWSVTFELPAVAETSHERSPLAGKRQGRNLNTQTWD